MPELRFDDHSEEVQDILGHIPRWIVRWGITLLFTTLLVIVVGSYFLKYPEKVVTPISITTHNAPAPVIVSPGGRIEKWFIDEKQEVQKGDVIAQLESGDDLETILELEELVNREGQLDFDRWSYEKSIRSLSAFVYELLIAQKSHENLLKSEEASNEVESLEREIRQKQKYLAQIQKQRTVKEREFELWEKNFVQDSIYYHDGGYGITKRDYENELLTYLGRKAAFIQYKASFIESDEAIIKLEQLRNSVSANYLNNVGESEANLRSLRMNLNTAIQAWKQKYLIHSPVKGILARASYWSNNQLVKPGDLIATVIPDGEKEIYCRAKVSISALGRVKVGQKVIIKLDGFPYLQYGNVEGSVISISLVPVENQYILEIELPNGMITDYGEEIPLIQEMTGMAEILTKESRLIYKLIGNLGV